jgi:hypothetical protein
MRGKAERPRSENESGTCGRTGAGRADILILTDRRRPQNTESCGPKFIKKIQTYEKLRNVEKRSEVA